jgi:CBS domain-containing protein
LSSLDIKAFVSSIEPFDSLSDYLLEDFCSKIDIAYFKKGQLVAKSGDATDSFYIIAKGVVVEKTADDQEIYHGERDFFDFESLLDGSYKVSYSALDECLLYEVKKDDFLSLVHTNSKLESYFLKNFAKRLVEQQSTTDSYLVKRVSDIPYQKPIFVMHSDTIFTAVSLMTKENKTFVLVTFDDGEVGIVTDSDLRKKVILARMDFDLPIGAIATRNLASVNDGDFLFNALLIMTKRNVKRLLVLSDGNAIGVLQDIDILSSFSTHTQFISRKIELARDTEELKSIMADIDTVIGNLMAEGVKAKHFCKLITELNTQIFKKIYESLADEEILANTVLVVMGSEGRGEQILRTDQDNAIIIRDGYENPRLEEISRKFNETLVSIEYPPCDGGVMAQNSAYRKTLAEFKSDIFESINHPSPDGFLSTAILMDMRAVSGDFALCDELLDYLHHSLKGNPNFLARLAGGSLAFETPLGIFNTFLLDKKAHKDELDIKKGAVFPIVNSIRALANEYGINSANSFERIKELNNQGLFDRGFAEELIESYNFVLEVRLKERMYKIKTGGKPDNYISPSRLSKIDRDILKDVFRIVDKLKKLVYAHYKLGYLG